LSKVLTLFLVLYACSHIPIGYRRGVTFRGLRRTSFQRQLEEYNPRFASKSRPIQDSYFMIHNHLCPGPAGFTDRVRYLWGVDRLSQADKPYAVAAAAGHDLNNELTVMLTGIKLIMEMLEPDHAAVPLLHDLVSSVQRCTWRASELLTFSARRGLLAGPTPVERLLE
jgi:signal transduction histidine kinase